MTETAASTPARTGLLHTVEHLSAARAGVEAGTAQYAAAWSQLAADPRSAVGWTASPAAVLQLGGERSNHHTLLDDAHAAYQNALIWRISGDEAHARTSCAILNSWAGELTSVSGDPTTSFTFGVHGFLLANAAELVRDRADFDATAAEAMLTGVFLPLNTAALTDAEQGCARRFGVVNQLAHLASMSAIAAFAGDAPTFAQAVDFFENRPGAPVANTIPFPHDEGTGQVQSINGVALAAAVCEMAWNQGHDLYSSQGSRLLPVAEWVAATADDYTYYQDPDLLWGTSSSGAAWAILHDHYAGRQGAAVSAKLTALANRARTEGAALDRLGLGGYAYFRG
ncbi:hypothetical protein [Promicromonospora sp. NPDC059942]|uniref:hypothetical protein n=1 Tax=Promicromonospora sp. NPDC059942 TaxID=3347009 RepID=UPI0036676F51